MDSRRIPLVVPEGRQVAGVYGQVRFNDFRGTAVTRPFAPGVLKKNIGIFTGHHDAEIRRHPGAPLSARGHRAEGIAAIEKLQAKLGDKIA